MEPLTTKNVRRLTLACMSSTLLQAVGQIQSLRASLALEELVAGTSFVTEREGRVDENGFQGRKVRFSSSKNRT